MKPVAIYTRVSTQEQAKEGYSLDAQLRSLRSFCEALEYTIVGIYEDKGISGKSIEGRPAMIRMLEDAKSNKFQEVIVWKINRLSRKQLDMLKIVDTLEKLNISVRSITEPFDTSNAAGRLLLNMLASIGEFERETTIDNLKQGMRQRALSGYTNGGRILGYDSIKTGENQSKCILQINTVEAETIKLIFKIYVSGRGYKYIANRLNELGLTTKNGNQFNIYAVRDIIMNPTYAGYVRFNNYVDNSKKRKKGADNEYVFVEGKHSPIIDKNTWDIAQKRIQDNTARQKKIHKGFALLSGLVKCPDCGKSMVIGRVSKKMDNGEKKVYRYYQCCTYKNYGSSVCKPNSIPLEKVETFVLTKLEKYLFDESFIDNMLTKANDNINEYIEPLKCEIIQLKEQESSFTNKKSKIFELSNLEN